MDIHNIISIGGMPGLYKVIGQSKNGVIVESLQDKKRFPAFASSPVSKLEDISIYTDSEDLPLKDVFKRIFDKEKGGKTIDPKASDEKAMRAYIESVVPEYDKGRVHISDLRKMFSWYNMLHETGLLTAEETVEEDGEKVRTGSEKDAKKSPGIKNIQAKKDIGLHAKTNAPKVKPQGVRKTGTA